MRSLNRKPEARHRTGARRCAGNESALGTRCQKLQSQGFTLLELLVTVAIIGILAATVIPFLRTTDADRLQGAAQILASDLEVARNLAVTNQSKYQLRFTPNSTAYYLEHSGTNSVLNDLPPSPFAQSNDPTTRHTTDLEAIASSGVSVFGISRSGTFDTTESNIEFTSLGSTSDPTQQVIWLTTGQGDEQRFLPVSVNATTGLIEIGEFTARNPRRSSLGSSIGGSAL